jgi:hypothetical protein
MNTDNVTPIDKTAKLTIMMHEVCQYQPLSTEDDLNDVENKFLNMTINPYKEDDVTVHFQGEIGLLTAKGTIIYRSKVFSSATAFAHEILRRNIEGKERDAILFKTSGEKITWGEYRKQTTAQNNENRLCKIYQYMKSKQKIHKNENKKDK